MKRGMVPGTSTTPKGLTETMDSQCREFLKHIRHIIFYAVPHRGTNIANYVEVLNSVVNLRLAGIVDNLKPFQMEMEELSDDFQFAIRQKPPIPIYAIVETQTYMKVKSLPKQQQFPLCAVSKMTDLRSFNMQISIFSMNLQFNQVLLCDRHFFWGCWVFHMQLIVVEKASAIHLANEWMTLDANHVNICKPKDKRDDGYRKVVQILEMIMEPQGDADDCCDTEYATPRAF